MVDDALRQWLHDRLDCMLDERQSLEGGGPVDCIAPLPAQWLKQVAPGDVGKATALFVRGLDLLRDVLGEAILSAGVPRSYRESERDRDVLERWLRLLQPILQPLAPSSEPRCGRRDLSVFEVLDALAALDAGEVRPIFAPKKGKNRRANRWSLAAAKLDALAWKERLRALGYGEKAANFEITKAFGEQWDTIRKWKPQCDAILGAARVHAELDYAGAPFDPYLRLRGMFAPSRLNALDGLAAAGERYRTEVKRAAELSKRKSKLAA